MANSKRPQRPRRLSQGFKPKGLVWQAVNSFRWWKEKRRLDNEVESLSIAQVMGDNVQRHIDRNNRKFIRMVLHEGLHEFRQGDS